MFWHDYVYNTLRTDKENQKDSANQWFLNFPYHKLTQLREKIYGLIIGYILVDGFLKFPLKPEQQNDKNYFDDCDYSILGSSSNTYQQYSSNIRKEYWGFSDEYFYPERKKFLKKLLEKEFIFNTQHFRDKYEEQARINIQKEADEIIYDLLLGD